MPAYTAVADVGYFLGNFNPDADGGDAGSRLEHCIEVAEQAVDELTGRDYRGVLEYEGDETHPVAPAEVKEGVLQMAARLYLKGKIPTGRPSATDSMDTGVLYWPAGFKQRLMYYRTADKVHI